LGLHAAGARPLLHSLHRHPALLRRRPGHLRPRHARRHPRLSQRADLHDGRPVDRPAESRSGAVVGRFPHRAAVARLGPDPGGRPRVEAVGGGGLPHRGRAHGAAVRLHAVDAYWPGHAGDGPGPRRRDPDGHRHRPGVPAHLRARHRRRRRRRGAGLPPLRRLSDRRAAVRPAVLRRGRAGRPRRHGRRADRQPHRGGRGGGGLVLLRDRLEGDSLLPPLHRRARLPPGRPVRAARRREPRRVMAGALARHRGALVVFGVAAIVPVVVRDAYFLDSLVLILLWGALSAAWNVAGGYAGQVSIGHAAFFGIGAYAAALLSARFQQSPWLGMLVGVALSLAAGGAIGYPSNRLQGPYFPLSTIALSPGLLVPATPLPRLTLRP